MPCYVGLDVSKRKTNICVVDDEGRVLREGVVASDPKAIVSFLRGDGWRYKRVGLEAWGLTRWLYTGLARAGLPVFYIEAHHASAVLKAARANKTDRNDALGIAEMMRTGIFKMVHLKSAESQRIQGLLTARKLLKNKTIDFENGIRALLLNFGLKLGTGKAVTFQARVSKLVAKDTFASELIRPLLAVRKGMFEQLAELEKQIEKLANADPVCRRLMTAPGVGPITSLAFRASIDEPGRFARSRDVGPHFGLTPRSYQSGDRDRRGGISKRGDRFVRSMLVLAARAHLRRNAKLSWLKSWGDQVAARRGLMRANIAVARRLAIALHRMWVTETDFRWAAEMA